jgi:glycosyltransferase involved in cell wall biosynthesis
MKICILLPYANPHDTGWIDKFISITKHAVVVGVIHSVKKYRNDQFDDADDKSGYLYFFKGNKFKKLFYKDLRCSDCLITLGIFESWFIKSLYCNSGIKMVYVLSEPLRPGSNYSKLLLRRAYILLLKTIKNSSKFSFLCIGGNLVKKQYLSLGFKRAQFYHFGHFPALSLTEKQLDEQSVIKFIYVGQLIPRKGIDILILIIEYLQKKYLNWKFLIIGKGILKEQFLDNIKNEKRVEYIENIKDPKILKNKFNENQILFLPSYFDGWGAVVNEALSSCCSLLLSEMVYAGIELLKNNENGFSFNPYELNDLYQAVDNYFRNPSILKEHFHKSKEIFSEWNHVNAAFSFQNLLSQQDNRQNETLLKTIA